MIPAILDYLSAKNKLDRHSLSFVLTNGGYYRNQQRFRNTCLIFLNAKPYLIARWYSEQGELLNKEAEALIYLAKKEIACPKFTEIVQISDTQVLFEEFIQGQSLEHLLTTAKLSVEEAIRISEKLFTELLDKTSEPSSVGQFNAELDGLFELASRYAVFEHRNISLAKQKSLIFKAYHPFGLQTSFAHNDFISKNILLSEDSSYLFDLEFAARSHFYSNDWFRMLMYSPGLSAEGSFRSAMVDESLLLTTAPTRIKQLLVNEQTIKALKLLAYLRDFQIKVEVSDSATITRLVGMLDAQICDCFLDGQKLGTTKSEGKLAAEISDKEKNETLKRVRELEIDSMRLRRQIAANEQAMSAHLEIIKSNEQALAKQLELIRSIEKSPSFRIGKTITRAIKLVPGLKS
jgi:hypothetical protein